LTNAFDGRDDTRASLEVMANSLFSIGMESVLSEKQAFINFSRELLISRQAFVLPPGLWWSSCWSPPRRTRK
jgi:c-di-GMP-related signal transduction protein